MESDLDVFQKRNLSDHFAYDLVTALERISIPVGIAIGTLSAIYTKNHLQIGTDNAMLIVGLTSAAVGIAPYFVNQLQARLEQRADRQIEDSAIQTYLKDFLEIGRKVNFDQADVYIETQLEM